MLDKTLIALAPAIMVLREDGMVEEWGTDMGLQEGVHLM
tara:strand:+ start:81 stop:197 length:117 start_codon:yes stop_codon:yes gene_type:complete